MIDIKKLLLNATDKAIKSAADKLLFTENSVKRIMSDDRKLKIYLKEGEKIIQRRKEDFQKPTLPKEFMKVLLKIKSSNLDVIDNYIVPIVVSDHKHKEAAAMASLIGDEIIGYRTIIEVFYPNVIKYPPVLVLAIIAHELGHCRHHIPIQRLLNNLAEMRDKKKIKQTLEEYNKTIGLDAKKYERLADANIPVVLKKLYPNDQELRRGVYYLLYKYPSSNAGKYDIDNKLHALQNFIFDWEANFSFISIKNYYKKINAPYFYGTFKY